MKNINNNLTIAKTDYGWSAVLQSIRSMPIAVFKRLLLIIGVWFLANQILWAQCTSLTLDGAAVPATLCRADAAPHTLAVAPAPGAANGNWSIVRTAGSGATPTFSATASSNANFVASANGIGTYKATWTVSTPLGGCTAGDMPMLTFSVNGTPAPTLSSDNAIGIGAHTLCDGNILAIRVTDPNTFSVPTFTFSNLVAGTTGLTVADITQILGTNMFQVDASGAGVTPGLATFNITTNNGCGATTITGVKVLITAATAATASLTEDMTVCFGRSAPLTIKVVGGTGNFTATIANLSGSIGNTDGDGTTTVNVTPTATTTYTLTSVKDANGCPASIVSPTSASIIVVPDVIASSANTTGTPYRTCNTDPVSIIGAATIRGGVADGYTVGTWTTNGTGVFGATNANATTYTPSVGDVSLGNIILTWTPSNPPCPNGQAASAALILDNPIILPTINGSAAPAAISVCGQMPTILLAGAAQYQVGGAAYTVGAWTSTGTGTFAPNASTANATYTPADVEVGAVTTLTWTPANPVGSICPAPTPVTIDVAVSAGKITSISSVATPLSVCVNSPVNITATVLQQAAGGASAPYTVGNWSIIAGAGTFGSVTANATTFTPTTSGTVTVRWTPTLTAATAPCNIQPNAFTQVTFAATASPTVSIAPAGPTNICQGSTLSLAANAASGTAPYTYSWLNTPAANGTLSSNNTASTIFSGNVIGVSTLNVTVTDASGCSAIATTTVNVTATTAPAPVIATPLSVSGTCASAPTLPITVSASVSGVTYVLYRYSSVPATALPASPPVIPAGATMLTTLPGNGANLVFPAQSIEGSYVIVATAVGGCMNRSVALSLDVTNAPIVADVAMFMQCSTTPGGVTSVFDLTTQFVPIVGVTSTCPPVAAADRCIRFYNTYAFAFAGGANFVASPAAFVSPTAQIFARVFNSTGCFSIAAINLVVKTTPIVTLTGAPMVCVGATTPFVGTPVGGTFASTPGVAASVSATGVVSGLAVGTSVISYTVSANTCSNTATKTITVVAAPTAGPITGPTAVCVGQSIVLNGVPAAGATPYTHTWTSNNTNITIAANNNMSAAVTGITAGSSTLVYTVRDANGCTSSAMVVITINPSPATPSITGLSMVCVGATTQLAATPAGGTWASSAAGTATASPTGLVTGVVAGNVNITYTVTLGTCTLVATFPMRVNANPTANAITGATELCEGSNITLTPNTTGGLAPYSFAWSSGTPTAATVTNSGVVTGIAAGVSNIGYVVTDANGCTASSPSFLVTVNGRPAASITGSSFVCRAGLTMLNGNPAGGTLPYTHVWTSSNTTVATVINNNDGTVAVDGVTNGTATISYAVTDAKGCTSNTSYAVRIGSCIPIVADPCVCKNNATTETNGQFDEKITVFAPAGQTWYIVSVSGLFQASSLAPPAAPTPFVTGATGNLLVATATGYELNGIHVDNVGFTITVTNGLGDILTISNTCVYPHITNLLNSYCIGDPAVTLTANVPGTFTVNGAPAITFDPTALPAGVHTVVFTPTAGGPEVCNPVTKIIRTGTRPAPTNVISCNDFQVSLDLNCQAIITPDMVLSGGGFYCESCYTVNVIRNGVNSGNAVSSSDIGKTLSVSVRDCNTPSNSCWSNVLVEDKLPPRVICPADRTIYCGADTSVAALGNADAFDCSGISSLQHSNFIGSNTCSAASFNIIRTFIVTDNYGYSASCFQTITVNRPLINASLVYVDNDTLYNCASPNTTPAALGFPQLLIPTSNTPPYGPPGNPYIDTTDLRPNTYCNVNITFTDATDLLCSANTKKITRTWMIQDICTNVWVLKTQLIFIFDTVRPIVNLGTSTDTLKVTTNFGSCSAVITAPAATATDACSAIATLTASIYLQRNAPAVNPLTDSLIATVNIMPTGGILNTSVPTGTYYLLYRATDQCGNFGTATRYVQVRDLTQPVAVCRTNTSVSLTTNSPTRVLATVFNENSQDNCCLANFEVRRMTGETDADFKPYIDLGCADIGNRMVIMRVFDCSGNSNICMVNIIIEDKVNPTITAPPSVTVDCGSYNLQASGLAASYLNLNFGTVVPRGQVRNAVFVNIYEIPANNSAVNVGLDGEADDNCTVTITQTFTSNVNSCGIGTVIRTFTATDAGGRTATATQTITVQNSTPFYINDLTSGNLDPTDGVIWPADVTFIRTGCQLGDLSPTATGRPTVISGSCDQVFVGVESDTFELMPTAGTLNAPCFKILRTWKIIDWCQANIPGRTYRWTYTQVIKVIDNTPPVFEFPTASSGSTTVVGAAANSTINVAGNTCIANVTIATPNVLDCNPNTTLTITSNMGLNGAIVSGVGPFMVSPGIYTVNYTAEDGCGNVATRSATVTVRDGKKPTPVCFVSTTAFMQPPACMVTLTTHQVNNYSYDNCTPGNLLRYRLELAIRGNPNPTFNPNLPVSSANARCLAPTVVPLSTNPVTLDTFVNIFPCDLQPGALAKVRMYVIDAAGNFDYCETNVIITNLNGCPGNQAGSNSAAIAGVVKTEMNDNVGEVNVAITDNNPFTTTSSGAFSFAGLPMGNNYTVTPVKDMNPTNGVSTLDLVLISRHILGIDLLPSPYKIIAADVNKSGSVSTLDIVELRKVVLHVNDNFTNNTSWRFVDKTFVFPEPANPFASTFPETMSISQLDHDVQADFVGVKIGDVNNSAAPNSLLGTEEHNAVGTFHLQTEEKMLKAGDTYTIDFSGEAVPTVQGYQFTLNFDKTVLEVTDLKTTALMPKEFFGLSLLSEGAITASWNAAQGTDFKQGNKNALFSLVVKAKTDVTLSRALTLNSRYTAAEAYTKQAELLDVDLQFQQLDGSNNVANEFALYQNTPNPFDGATTIGFHLPQAGEATLTFFDTDGKVLKTIIGDYAKGYNVIAVSANDLGNVGSKLIYYQLRTATATATRKAIIE